MIFFFLFNFNFKLPNQSLFSSIQLCSENDNYINTWVEFEQHPDCKIMSSLSVWSSACVCLWYCCGHAWEVFICRSLLTKSYRDGDAGGEEEDVKRKHKDEEVKEDSGEERCFFREIRSFLSVSLALCFSLMVMDGPPLWNNGTHRNVQERRQTCHHATNTEWILAASNRFFVTWSGCEDWLNQANIPTC